ncbi:C40 family peptidase [Corynebacterium sp.]|uniref:C40 family peptidase n=1 Tax=Corynebacterium sp. TaxID=1720 RepID=UPI0026DC7A3E|nr:C40 family peptidase [Corynebacterium sp.]MDO5075958.1 C40 family peptidase [Corynebacterium sp.]
MGKHSRRNSNTVRNAATASAVAVGATVAFAGPAQAADVVIPNTGITFNVPGIENIPGVQNVPGAQDWVPALDGQSAPPAGFALPGLPAANNGQAIVDAAASKIGAPYVWGAAGPNAFDCSGLTSWAYQQVGKQIPRTSYDQAASGHQVSYDQLQPGDIVAFYSGASHVGIYTGHGTVIHASTEGVPLSEVPMDQMPFHSAVRY